MTCLQGKQAEQRFKHQAKHAAHPLFSGHHIQYPCPAGKSGLSTLAISSGSYNILGCRNASVPGFLNGLHVSGGHC